MGQIEITTSLRVSKLSKREQLLVLEIGDDKIDSASAFVSYISESYGFSKSSVWYTLKKLKELGVLDFASRDEPGKVLELTKQGAYQLRDMVKAGVRIDELEIMPNDQHATGLVAHPIIVRAFG